jgi:hypothetical protein
MRNIKTILEFFDDDDFKSQYEIPYLKGEMPEVISKFKDYESSEDIRFLDVMRYQFPVLNHFNYKVVEKGENKIHLLFATSLKHVNGDDYYASITFAFHKEKYTVITIFRKLKSEDKSKWDVKEHKFDDIHSTFPVVEDFIKRCEDFNIIIPDLNFNIQSN